MTIGEAFLALLQAMQPTVPAEKSKVSSNQASPRIYFQRAQTERDVDLDGNQSSLQETLFDLEVGSLDDEGQAQTIIDALKEGVSLTELAAAAASSDTTLTVASSAGMQATANFVVTIDQEQILVTAIAGASLTVTRGFSGTSPASHANGAAVTIPGLNGYRGALGASGIFCHGAFVADHADDYVPKMLDADEGYFTAACQVQMIHEGG